MTDTRPRNEIGRKCQGQLAFETEYTARKVSMKLHKKTKRITRPYQCSTCGKYHSIPCSQREFERFVVALL